MMSVLKIEGFEKYSSLNDILGFYRYANYQTPVIISSADSTGVTARNNLSCLKLTSTQANNLEVPQRLIRFPKFGIQEIPSHSNGILGFAYYAYVPTGGSYSPFTPIAALCDIQGRPHLFVCVNGSRQIEIRRWNTSASMGSNANISAANLTWNSDVVGIGPPAPKYCNNLAYYQTWFSTPSTVSAGECGSLNLTANNSVINSNAFTLIHTSTGTLNASAWNYIEVEYDIKSSSTGSIKIRLNSNPSTDPSSIDSQTLNVQTTTQPTNTAGAGFVNQVAFGTFWAHKADGAGSFYSDKVWNTTTHWISYFDDIYLLQKNAVVPNNFLGSVSCLKGDFDTLVSNTAVSGNLASISDATIGSANLLTNRVVINNYNQNIQVRCSGLAVDNSANIKFVQPAVFGYDLGGAPLKIKTILNTSEASSEIVLDSNSISGSLKFGDGMVSDPSNNNWTGSNLKNTIFSFGS
jgi:hypothetical protein